ncbi:ABC transporter permease [Pedobacter sp. HMF7647]|uniref:ABC transporter permease n=1 Tax=Hufsiella arboris TaxID=2695275 RepID=A0A7K1YAD0_9SPHI|nr:ABC transporter permease [Hufsiella arboris]MXV51535.1 ABC transporter permease [Hufsiella arboris]
MNKILLIIQREYMSRVRKKSFLVMTFLVPGLIIGMYGLIAYLTITGGDKLANVKVLDESGVFAGKFKNTKSVLFSDIKGNVAEEKKKVAGEDEGFLLYIPTNIQTGGKTEMYSKKKAGIYVLSNIEDQMNEIMRTKQLHDAGIDLATLDKIKPDFTIDSKEITAEGEKDSSSGAAYGVGFAAAILIYIALFIYGSQVMRGVIEEKTNRIVEVVISSVKPFQLMMGKIIGIGLVGLTQFLLWIILSTTLTSVASSAFSRPDPAPIVKTQHQTGSQKKMADAQKSASDGPGAAFMKAMDTIDFKYILALFLTYFLGGFMLYSALFAAVGSAVDNETETQQFMLPITLPLLFTYIMAFSFIVNNPDSTLSFWLSIIPFTSPIAMMVRIPFGVPGWEIALSVALLIGGFILTTWIASRIYRVGILMYGKKTSYKELVKWFSYKE